MVCVRVSTEFVLLLLCMRVCVCAAEEALCVDVLAARSSSALGQAGPVRQQPFPVWPHKLQNKSFIPPSTSAFCLSFTLSPPDGIATFFLKRATLVNVGTFSCKAQHSDVLHSGETMGFCFVFYCVFSPQRRSMTTTQTMLPVIESQERNGNNMQIRH